MNFSDIYFLGINCLLGAGIFLTPGKAYSAVGVNLFWILIICAVLAIILSLVFAEMAGIFTRTGGVYVYASTAWGKFIGFNTGFMRFLAACIALAVQVTALPSILASAFGIDFSIYGKMVVSLGFLLLLCLLNLISVKIVSLFTRLSSKVIIVVLAGCILVSFVNFQPANLYSVQGLLSAAGSPVPELWKLNSSQFSAGFLLLFYAFVGFENIGVAAQDMRNPTRDVPRAIICVLATVAVIYILLFTSVQGNMGGEKLVKAENAVADSVGLVLGEWGTLVVSLGSVVALFGIGLAMLFSGPRNIVPLASDKFFPESVGANNSRGVPAVSIVIMSCISAFFVILGNIISSEVFVLLVQIATVCRLLQYMVVAAGIFRIRKKFKSTWTMPFAIALIPLCLLVCVYLFIQLPSVVLFISLGVIIFSLIVWYFYSAPRIRRLQLREIEEDSPASGSA
ncbi:TPA: APC family permease [Escherichia coli]|nr:APC family permease [Escherichia coli]